MQNIFLKILLELRVHIYGYVTPIQKNMKAAGVPRFFKIHITDLTTFWLFANASYAVLFEIHVSMFEGYVVAC